MRLKNVVNEMVVRLFRILRLVDGTARKYDDISRLTLERIAFEWDALVNVRVIALLQEFSCWQLPLLPRNLCTKIAELLADIE